MKKKEEKKTQAKPGRPKKPAVPAATPADLSPSALMAQELERAKARAAAGHRLANHEARVLRDAWLLDQAKHLWPSTEACAADLGVSVSTVRGYADEGCPDITPHSPIPKAPVLLWLLRRAHQRGGAEHASQQSLEEVDLSIKRAKEAKLWGTLVAEAEDRATQGVIESQNELRHALKTTLPTQAAEAARAAADITDAAERIANLIEQTLLAHPYAPPTTATTTQAPT